MLRQGRIKYVDYFLLDGVRLTDNPYLLVDTPPAKNVEYKRLYDGTDVRIVSQIPTTRRRAVTLSWNRVSEALYQKFHRLYLNDTAFYITMHTKSVTGDILEPQRNNAYAVDYTLYRGMYKNWLDDPEPIIYKNDVAVVSGSGYSVISASGAVLFDQANEAGDEISADYTYRMRCKIDEEPDVTMDATAIKRIDGVLKQLYSFTVKLVEVD